MAGAAQHEVRGRPDLASALNGFQGDDYVLVGNQLVIVDAAVRRVVAIPEVAPT